ncbi:MULTISPECIES: (2Fe-2S)-binding protein [Roseobacter]|uniref:Isoquinoline 1-oxidoreductase subunit alpha n=1 Tax=Roseobacter litoralis (strain ATCC 49566 / DSM 6996 / JCM 21268 / NBRC 15278 / OCh 149) TaxID=391595 RepID=F7ZI76_ROSLO|nr:MULTISPECIES: (2Fe-2S)-binding protein [Roseobacter]AEI96212.1 isoquinoline 1-oxidoreductase subunit alpha [Roseobacter litoralis Och 149]GIT86460.1 (2Fe-2S)-binding protein [Roseobacter sp. OBYS 0001]
MPTTFSVNGNSVTLDVDPDMPLLWALRDHLKLTGTKYGCGIAQCGSCTIMLDGFATRSCVTAVGDVAGAEVQTIEGVESAAARAVQEAWTTLNVAQCGYCQSGQVLVATELLENTPKPTDEEIDAAMGANICRCATYARIRKGIRAASDALEV